MTRISALLGSLAALTLAMAPAIASAAALQVAPVLLDIPAPGATSTLTLRNEGPTPLNAQIRVFRWTQVNGQDRLEPSTDVVASPPAATLASRSDYAVRVVRLNKTPVDEEEAYRLVVDELPDANRERNGAVAVVLRHSVPLFFEPADAEQGKVRWTAFYAQGRIMLKATNEGGKRVRYSALKVTDGKSSVSFGDGLVGYALAGSSVTFMRPAPKALAGGRLTITGQSDHGPVNVQIAIGR